MDYGPNSQVGGGTHLVFLFCPAGGALPHRASVEVVKDQNAPSAAVKNAEEKDAKKNAKKIMKVMEEMEFEEGVVDCSQGLKEMIKSVKM